MSHPNPSHDRSNEYPDDNYKPVRKEFQMKKKNVAKKMKKSNPFSHPHPNSLLGNLKRELKELEGLRKRPLWMRQGPGGHGDLPPGYHDSDNE